MSYREELRCFNRYEYHKGFYNDGVDPTKTLYEIEYTDFFDDPNDNEFPFNCAYYLLCGSCTFQNILHLCLCQESSFDGRI